MSLAVAGSPRRLGASDDVCSTEGRGRIPATHAVTRLGVERGGGRSPVDAAAADTEPAQRVSALRPPLRPLPVSCHVASGTRGRYLRNQHVKLQQQVQAGSYITSFSGNVSLSPTPTCVGFCGYICPQTAGWDAAQIQRLAGLFRTLPASGSAEEGSATTGAGVLRAITPRPSTPVSHPGGSHGCRQGDGGVGSSTELVSDSADSQVGQRAVRWRHTRLGTRFGPRHG